MQDVMEQSQSSIDREIAATWRTLGPVNHPATIVNKSDDQQLPLEPQSPKKQQLPADSNESTMPKPQKLSKGQRNRLNRADRKAKQNEIWKAVSLSKKRTAEEIAADDNEWNDAAQAEKK